MEPSLSLLFDPADYTVNTSTIPDQNKFEHWVLSAIKAVQPVEHAQLSYEVSVALITPADIQCLNQQYRDKNSLTNVLSFPSELPTLMQAHESDDQQGDPQDDMPAGLRVLGDIVICPDVVINESVEQKKAPYDHWAHMVIHSTFHLFGMDHITENDANTMESLEIQLLSQLGIANPYEALSGQRQ